MNDRPSTAAEQPVHELRVALTVDDFDAARRFYEGALGLPVREMYEDGEARVVILEAGRATLELVNRAQAALIDDIEVGRRCAGVVRLALEVGDSTRVGDDLVHAGATRLGGPVLTAWNDRNVRLQAPDGMQLTLFTPEAPTAIQGAAPDESFAPWIELAIDLALSNVDEGQLPFGAVVVRDGAVIATGVNTAVRESDPTAHAETAAIRAALRDIGLAELTGATVVSSAEPCPMCHAGALLAGVERLLYAAPRALAAEYGFVLPSTMAEMQRSWRGEGADVVQHVASSRADEPFRAYARSREAGGDETDRS
jgi:tRNA(Arg) A34 adenosine deaminase TadA